MKYNLLGRSGLSVSEIGFGCMSLEPGAPDSQSVIDMAIGKGINFFDTADMYNKGENETELGKLLGSRRKNLIIATKVGNEWRKDGSGWDWNAGREYIMGAVEKSLQRLKTDYIDLYQLHGGMIEDNISETIGAFEALVQQGKIRYYGISSIRPEVIRRYLALSNISTVMMQYSLLDRRPKESVTELLREHKVSMLARGSLAKGLLAGKPAKDFLNYTAEEVAVASDAIQSLAGRTAAATAIRFVLDEPAVASAIVGMRTVKHCLEAAAASDAAALKQDEMNVLEKSVSMNFYKEHR
ncbi:MAG: aldo/keto reductase [Chitinophagaceae bacterium]